MTGWTYLDTLPSDLILNEGVLALVSEADSGSVPTLQSAARERQVDLLGAIVPGLVIEDEFRRRGTLLVPLQSVPRVMVPVPEADHTPNETIEALADFVLEHAAEGGGDTLMLLVDATIADVASGAAAAGRNPRSSWPPKSNSTSASSAFGTSNQRTISEIPACQVADASPGSRSSERKPP